LNRPSKLYSLQLRREELMVSASAYEVHELEHDPVHSCTVR
jgi:hypothetical protein